MDFVIIEICKTCRGVIDGENLILESKEYHCRCDWWGDTDPNSESAEGTEQIEEKK